MDDNPSRMVASIAAEGRRLQRSDPDALLQAALIRSAQKALAGRRTTRPVRDRVDSGPQATGSSCLRSPGTSRSRTRRSAAIARSILNIVDAPANTAFRVNGRSYDENRIDAVLPLGKAEEWRAVALNEDHPLHIHINPFQIVSIKDAQGRDVTDPKSPAFDPEYAGLKGRVEGHDPRQGGHCGSPSERATSASPATSSCTATSCTTAIMA